MRDLTRRFGRGDAQIVAADALTLDIPAGQTVAIMGPSGSGKSTLLHLLGGIESADSGCILVDGADLTKMGRAALSAYRRTVGFVFQRFHLLPALNVLDNIALPAVPQRVEFDRVARARELVAAVGLAGRELAYPAQLSGGQQQRVAIARALFGRPRLILADEPTGNLDSATGREIIELILRMSVEHHATLLVATHDTQIASQCERLIEMRDGRLAASTTTSSACYSR